MFHLKKSTAIYTFLIFSAAFLGTRISFGQDHVFPDYSRWSDQAVVNYLGHKHPHYLGVIAKHAGYLELDYEQRVSIELAIQEIGKLRGGAYYSAAFPEIDGFAPDFLDRIASLNLDPVEFASRKAFAHNMLQKTGGEYVKLEKRRAASILLPHQKKLANNLIVFNAMRDFTLDELIKGAETSNELELSQDERDELLKASKEIQASIKAEVLKLQREGWNKLMDKLPKEKREKFEGFLLIDSGK